MPREPDPFPGLCPPTPTIVCYLVENRREHGNWVPVAVYAQQQPALHRAASFGTDSREVSYGKVVELPSL